MTPITALRTKFAKRATDQLGARQSEILTARNELMSEHGLRTDVVNDRIDELIATLDYRFRTIAKDWAGAGADAAGNPNLLTFASLAYASSDDFSKRFREATFDALGSDVSTMSKQAFEKKIAAYDDELAEIGAELAQRDIDLRVQQLEQERAALEAERETVA
jgi:hypothetical protein